jgi:hypothetical protein
MTKRRKEKREKSKEEKKAHSPDGISDSNMAVICRPYY